MVRVLEEATNRKNKRQMRDVWGNVVKSTRFKV